SSWVFASESVSPGERKLGVLPAPPPRYPMLVRLPSHPRSMAIRQLTQASFLKLVKAPRVRQGGIFSIFSSSVNEGQGDADNQEWPPLGWRARVGQDDRLEASATVTRP